MCRNNKCPGVTKQLLGILSGTAAASSAHHDRAAQTKLLAFKKRTQSCGVMNVINVLCSPFIEALSANEAFDIVVPKNSDCDLDNVLEIEMDDENVLGRKSKVVRGLADLDGCKAYAQIMAVAAFVLELKSGELLRSCLPCERSVLFND